MKPGPESFSSKEAVGPARPPGNSVRKHSAAMEREWATAQACLRKVEKILSARTLSAPAGFYLRSLKDGCDLWTPDVFNIFGIELADRPPSREWLYQRIDVRDRQRMAVASQKAFEEGRKYT